MPPKQTITRHMIISAAFDLARQKGKTALSARNIAAALSCSTQPIYSCFSTMKDLEDIVTKKILDFIIRTYLTGSLFSDDPFFSMGLGYVNLAKTDPHLFDMIYMSGHTQKLFGSSFHPKRKAGLVQTMKKDETLSRLETDTLTDILGHMWIYTHGLAMLARVNPNLSERIIHDRLHEMGRTLIFSKLAEKGITPDENNCH